MDTNDFYEDDESVDERHAAWTAGERGRTSGPRDLNQRARSIVDQVAARWDADGPVTDIEERAVVFGVIPDDARDLPVVPTMTAEYAGTRT